MEKLAALSEMIFKRRKLSLLVGAGVGVFVAIAGVYLQNDIHRNLLDPKIPFQIYMPPPAPDYNEPDNWYLNPALAQYSTDSRKVDVFFIHGTSYDGGKEWLAPLSSQSAQREVIERQLPNYARPFAIMGNIYAPKYRQASLYTQLTLREDAREARMYAYRDVEAAFEEFLRTRKGKRGFVIVGLEQGGLLAQRLLTFKIAHTPELRNQLVAAYLLETLVPQDVFVPETGIPSCQDRHQSGCVFAYLSVDSRRPDRAIQMLQKAVFWESEDTLTGLGNKMAMCTNPLTGGPTQVRIDSKLSLGATNATGLEWGTEPALMPRKVSAHCVQGVLLTDTPTSSSFKSSGTWQDKRKIRSYNLFYGDLMADIEARWAHFSTPTE